MILSLIAIFKQCNSLSEILPKMSFAKRARIQNFNLEDTLKLVDAAKAYKNILENKKFDAVTSRDKQRAWEAISCLYNIHKQCH